MILSDTGKVNIDGRIEDVYADLALLIQVLAQVTVEQGFDAQTVVQNIVHMCCEGLATFLDEQQEDGELDEEVFDRLFEEAIKGAEMPEE